jgi:hypothetical protein
VIIKAKGIDPISDDPDPHGIPQIACPARRDDVNPQFTCLNCPCAASLDTHQAVDDRGAPFYLVDAVDCRFEENQNELDAVWREFPSLLSGFVENPPPRVEPGVACPLLSSPGCTAPLVLEIDGKKWVPVGNCRSCQFFRGLEGTQRDYRSGAGAGVVLVCAAPLNRTK